MVIRQRSGRERSALPLPLILVVLSLFVLMAFETNQAIHDRTTLAAVHQAQEPAMQQASRVRQQLQTLAGKTAALAAQGDAGAKDVVAQMKAQGVTLSVPKE
ncbi:MAG TPA: hypothetical protein VMF05_11505 [Stellaceae bacterium]|nr:hypothetical protein [Stellaceae bacterium]